jgi:hypothetical protein
MVMLAIIIAVITFVQYKLMFKKIEIRLEQMKNSIAKVVASSKAENFDE